MYLRLFTCYWNALCDACCSSIIYRSYLKQTHVLSIQQKPSKVVSHDKMQNPSAALITDLTEWVTRFVTFA